MGVELNVPVSEVNGILISRSPFLRMLNRGGSSQQPRREGDSRKEKFEKRDRHCQGRTKECMISNLRGTRNTKSYLQS